MAFTVRLIFEGVVAFVPDVPILFDPAKPSGVSKMEVRFPDLREPHSFPYNPIDAMIRHPHFLWIEVESHRVAKVKGRAVSHYHRQRPEDAEKLLLPVQSLETFSFHYPNVDGKKVPRPGRLEINETRPRPVPSPASSAKLSSLEQRSLWWIPRPAELSGQARHGTLLDDDKAMLGRLAFDVGYLFVPGHSRKGEAWAFYGYDASTGAPGGRELARAIGNSVALDLEVHSFQLNAIEETSKKKSSVLLREAADGDVVTIKFRNIEGEAVLGEELLPPAFDCDFAEFYNRSLGGQQYSDWVLPFPSVKAGSDRKPCAPALMTGLSK